VGPPLPRKTAVPIAIRTMSPIARAQASFLKLPTSRSSHFQFRPMTLSYFPAASSARRASLTQHLIKILRVPSRFQDEPSQAESDAIAAKQFSQSLPLAGRRRNMKRGSLSYRLAKALSQGRPGSHSSRESILAGLLRKRAAARRAGLREQEAFLREQIRWSLPVHTPCDPEPES
jgi:hypothetical protein